MSEYVKGNKVWIGRSAPTMGVVRPIVSDAATLQCRYGGRYPSSDLWHVTLASGARTVASESVMRPC